MKKYSENWLIFPLNHLMRLRRNIDLRIEPHPIGEDEFTEMNPFAVEIQKSGIELTVG